MARRWLRAPVLAVTLLLVLAAPIQAAPNRLSNATVTPTSGMPTTNFAFTVRYQGSPAAVSFAVGGRTVQMTVLSGKSSNGTFGGSTTLPVGSWQVTFTAVAQGNDDKLVGPTVTVTSTATPRPTIAPTPSPTTSPTPSPAAPTPIPTRAPPPITATPIAATPVPTATPSPIGVGSPTASGFIGGFILTPAPTASPDAAPALEGPGVDDEMWTLVTGGLIALSALAFLGMVGILRARRQGPVEQPIGPAEYRPPTGDE